MNWRFPAVVLLTSCLITRGQEPARLSIADVLRPETRLAAFREYRRRANAKDAQQHDEIADFSERHSNLNVTELRAGNSPPRYLLTWNEEIGEQPWSEVAASLGSLPPARVVLPPRQSLRFQIFSAGGQPLLEQEGSVIDGQVADLDGDGEPEVIERVSSWVEDTIPGLEPLAPAPDLITREFLRVRPLDINAPATFAILYNTHPVEHAAGNMWGFQLRDTDGDGLYEIELGPILAPEGVEPKISFHWDKTTGKWIGPEPKKGDHFRVLPGKAVAEEAARIVEEGGLGYPLAGQPPRPVVALPEDPNDTDSIPLERLSKPYRYQSLKDLSNEQLLAFMAERRSAWDYVVERIREATAVPEFWKLDPKSAARLYVERNRPPATISRYLLSIYNPANEPAPEQGDLTLSDAPSGCSAPGGAYIHHLHCAPEGSFLAYTEILRVGSATGTSTRFDVRKLAVSYEEARHLLQTVWWLSRTRSRQLPSRSSMGFMSGGSTSDGHATVQIVSGEDNLTVSGRRSAGHSGTFVGVGTTSENYDPSAFINLVVQLFRQKVPERLGQPWKAQEMPERWSENFSGPALFTPEELTRVKTMTVELLRLFRQRKLPAGAALQVLQTIGDMGWKDLREDIEAVAKLLPPPFEHEKHLARVRAEIAIWKQKLGAGAEEAAFRERDRRRFALKYSTSIQPGDTKPLPLSAEEQAKFATVDALYESLSEIANRAPRPERDIAELRSSIPVVLRQLEVFDAPKQLHRWALEDPGLMSFALGRLAVIDPKRAIELLHHCEAHEPLAFNRESYANTRLALEPGEPVADLKPENGPPSAEDRGQAITILRDDNAPYDARQRALAALVPLDEPKRYPDPAIDAALLGLLTNKGELSGMLSENTLMPAALRLGGKAWQALVEYAQTGWITDIPRLQEALPALTVIAQAEPEPYREKLQKILAAELESTHGYLDQSLWSIWQLDLRELKPRLEQIATSGPQDYEGTRARGASSNRQPVTSRFHRARQIASLWNEDDPLTRAKLHVAFAVAHAQEITDKSSTAHLQNQFAESLRSLSPGQRDALSAFVHWCEVNAAAKLDSTDPAELTSVLQAVRSAFPAR